MSRFVDRCPYSPTGWAWWEPWGANGRCTCEPASGDTHPKGGDVEQAPSPMSGAVLSESEADAQGPTS